MRLVGNVDSDSWVPSVEFTTVKLRQQYIDNKISTTATDSIMNITGKETLKFMEAVYNASRKVKDIVDGAYGHLDAAEKNIIKKCSEVEKEGDIKNGDLIKVSSILRTAVASVTFTRCMEYALGCRRLLNMSVAMAEAIIDDKKQEKKDQKRNK